MGYALVRLDLVLAGATLPADDGQRLVRQLRIERPDLPALFLVDASEQPSSADHRVKPFAVPALAAAIDKALADRPPSDGRETTLSARLMTSFNAPPLREVLAAWRAARAADLLPRLDPVCGFLRRYADWHFVAAVDRQSQPPDLHFRSVGHRAVELLGDDAGTLDADCARADLSLLPCYSHDQLAGDHKTPIFFERLTLPVSEDGETLSHLVGVVLLTDLPPTGPR